MKLKTSINLGYLKVRSGASLAAALVAANVAKKLDKATKAVVVFADKCLDGAAKYEEMYEEAVKEAEAEEEVEGPYDGEILND